MATIKDIAKASGFSVTTVSRALNGYNDVSAQTKQMIAHVAESLNYTPNIHAKNLVMQKSNRIGFIVFDFGLAAGEDNFVYELMIGMHQQCLKVGFELVFLFGSVQTPMNEDINALMQQYNLCGIVIMGCGKNSKTYKNLAEIQKPVVLIDGDLETEFVGCVSIDNHAASYEAVRYLIEQKNRKKILLINGKVDSYASIERLRGYKDALNGKYRETDVYYAEYSDKKSAEIIEEIWKQEDGFPYDAVFTTSDMMAIGAESALIAHGILVGEQIDIIGFDNIPLSEFIQVPLTTVAQYKMSLGTSAIQLLMTIINKTGSERRITVEHKLIVRASA